MMLLRTRVMVKILSVATALFMVVLTTIVIIGVTQAVLDVWMGLIPLMTKQQTRNVLFAFSILRLGTIFRRVWPLAVTVLTFAKLARIRSASAVRFARYAVSVSGGSPSGDRNRWVQMNEMLMSRALVSTYSILVSGMLFVFL